MWRTPEWLQRDKGDLRSSSRWVIGVVLVSIVISIARRFPPSSVIPPFGGHYDPRFESVASTFRQNFFDGLEREGANLAVYYKGQLVVNVWGGYADREADRKWNQDTRTMVFSASKAVASLCVAMLVDRRQLSYSDRVVRYWPEYGKYGKENTTVEDILTHRAGIPVLDHKITVEEAKSPRKIASILENARPLWKPGTETGYHAITFGWLVDILMRKVDRKHRGVNKFFKEEIAEPHAIDFDIGVSVEHIPQMARMSSPGIIEHFYSTLFDPRFLAMYAIMYLRHPEALVWKIRENPAWATLNYDINTFNDPVVQQLDLAAVTGASNAQNFAKIFALAIDGTLISNETLQLLATPTIDFWHIEQVVLWPIVKGFGFFYERHPISSGSWLLGHPGYGGQHITFDPESQLAIAYISNGLKMGSGELCATYQRIQRSVYALM